MQCRFIKGYEDYLIFADGNVYSRKSQKILKPGKIKTGYYIVALCKDGVQTTHKVHRLVADAFIPNPENKPCINHISGNKLDNRVENLEWVTHSENSIHATYTNLNHPHFGAPRPVIQYSKSGDIMAIYPSISEAEVHIGISNKNISAVCLDKRKSAGGFIWRYVDDEF